MVDWTSSMQQTFEFYKVDPNTWENVSLIENVKSCSITWDLDKDTLGSASIDMDSDKDSNESTIGECYIRIYLVTVQNGITEKHPLGTFLAQNPGFSFDGKVKSETLDAYSPLLELKDDSPPIGYYVAKNKNIMEEAFNLISDHSRIQVVKTTDSETIRYNFVAETDDSWLTFVIDFVANADMNLALDEMGTLLFSPRQDVSALQPVWIYNDDNSSILYPELTFERDLYGIPNTVEVIYSNDGYNYSATAVNDNENSPISTVNRGRTILYRVTNPEISGVPSGNTEKDIARVKEYAEQVLKEQSSIEYSVTYKHGYCPVRIGDCVMLNYERSGIINTKAKVVSQTIDCKTGCSVTEKAVYTTNLWR